MCWLLSSSSPFPRARGAPPPIVQRVGEGMHAALRQRVPDSRRVGRNEHPRSRRQTAAQVAEADGSRRTSSGRHLIRPPRWPPSAVLTGESASGISSGHGPCPPMGPLPTVQIPRCRLPTGRRRQAAPGRWAKLRQARALAVQQDAWGRPGTGQRRGAAARAGRPSLPLLRPRGCPRPGVLRGTERGSRTGS